MSDEELVPWATRLARELRDVPEVVDQLLDAEALRLARTAAKFAPRSSGALSKSFSAKGAEVRSSVPYAAVASEGGRVVARRVSDLLVPVKPGYRPGPGYVTIRARSGERIVVRSGTHELWAIRRREVQLRGSGYLGRALETHLEQADERVAAKLPDVGGAR